MAQVTGEREAKENLRCRHPTPFQTHRRWFRLRNHISTRASFSSFRLVLFRFLDSVK